MTGKINIDVADLVLGVALNDRQIKGNEHKMSKVNVQDVIRIILDIANKAKYRRMILNERYLHHLFSYLLQQKYHQKYCLTSLLKTDAKLFLHPEWPTCKASTKLNYSWYEYEKKDNIYLPRLNGNGQNSGFIDFAVGDYNKPNIGIEFTLKNSWSGKDIGFDFLKLADTRNPFRAGVSFNIIFRKNGLSQGGNLARLEDRMNRVYTETINQLGELRCSKTRQLYFIVSEIGFDNDRRHWHYSKKQDSFIRGLPSI